MRRLRRITSGPTTPAAKVCDYA